MAKIKICGLYRNEDIQAVNQYHPDFAGFIIDFPQSHRSISEETAGKFRQLLSGEIPAVGVFVDAKEETIIRLMNEDVIQLAQLHGNESEQEIIRIQKATKKPVIKAFRIQSKKDIDLAVHSPADYILLDYGKGEGKTFDWSLLEPMQRKWILAGGLGIENVKEAVQKYHPWAVDISSGVETEKRKDPQKIKTVIENIRTMERKK